MRLRFATPLYLIAMLTLTARADDPPRAIRGKAFVGGSDRAAAGVTLHFLDRDAPKLSLTTDAGGRFQGAVPAGVSVPEGQDGEPGPPCWMQAQGSGQWTWQPIQFTPHLQPDYARKLVSEALRRPVKTVWRQRGEVVNLEVRCPPTGEIEVLVRGPGGAPLADRPVQVVPDASKTDLHTQVAVRFDGRTDAAGRFRMGWFEGMLWLKVVVPGEGFGSTGLIEVRAGLIARHEMPPLARLGSIDGRLDPTLAGPSTTVVLDAQGQSLAEVTCGADGRFALSDVLPGTYYLRPRRAGNPAGKSAWVRVLPGQTVTGVTIGPERPRPAGSPRDWWAERFQPLPNRGKQVVWLEGTVRDEQHRGVAGARVFARATYDGGIRAYELTQTATTDERGRYQVVGPHERMMGAPAVIAHVEGRPPALAFAPMPGADDRPAALDLTLPDAGRAGSMRVTVKKDGRPMAGAHVGLAPLGSHSPLTAAGFGVAIGTERNAVEALSHPSVVTGPDGVARFTGLLPGRYELTAAELLPGGQAVPGQFVPGVMIDRVQAAEVVEDVNAVVAAVGDDGGRAAGANHRRDAAPIFARARGVDVAEGRETAFTIGVYPQPCTVALRVFHPDGTPVAGRSVELSYGLGTPSTTTSINLDGRGTGRYDFELPGLWDIEVRFRDSASESRPVRDEPFYEARALVPVSPALTLDEPIKLVGVRRGLGSLRGLLLDRDGRPARGTVIAVDILGQPEFGATTDDKGTVTFRDLPSGEYRLRGYIDGLSAVVPDPDPTRPAPEDAALRGQAMVPAVTAAVAPGREAAIELRARAVGYVRGMLRPPAGHKTADYVITPAFDGTAAEPVERFDPESGEFLDGPLVPGKAAYRFEHAAEDGTSREAGVQNVEVPAGEVAHVDLRPLEPKPEPARAPGAGQRARPRMGAHDVLVRDPGAVVRTVVLDDGQTPAFAARSLLFVPGESQAVQAGFSDANGQLTWHGLWIVSSGDRSGPPAGLVDRPTVVVWIPGRTGAAIQSIEPGRPVRITLPAPRSAKGLVTLGGRPVDGRNARIRIVADHRGRGVLNEALSAETTAQADGRFDLRGLTPGRYAVQAARDGIWLSQGIELTVTSNQDPPPLALDIPEPGRTVELQAVDREGRPAADRPISVVRPEGPMAALWPAALPTGPDGTLTLRALEAGRHTLIIGAEKARRVIEVPAAGGAATQPVVVRMVVP